MRKGQKPFAMLQLIYGMWTAGRNFLVTGLWPMQLLPDLHAYAAGFKVSEASNVSFNMLPTLLERLRASLCNWCAGGYRRQHPPPSSQGPGAGPDAACACAWTSSGATRGAPRGAADGCDVR